MRQRSCFSRAALVERSDGPKRTLTLCIWVSLSRWRPGLLRRSEQALVLVTVSEMRRMVRRIGATRLHRTNQAVSIAVPPGLLARFRLARSYTHICSLGMQELSVQSPWFCLPATQAALRGAQGIYRNPGWNSDTGSKHGSSAGSLFRKVRYLRGMTWYRSCSGGNARPPRPHNQQRKEDDKEDQQPEVFLLASDW
jgi:hypothetical protein